MSLFCGRPNRRPWIAVKMAHQKLFCYVFFSRIVFDLERIKTVADGWVVVFCPANNSTRQGLPAKIVCAAFVCVERDDLSGSCPSAAPADMGVPV